MTMQSGFLVIEGGSLQGRRFALPTAGTLRLGREVDCEIRFDPQQDRMVGRHHARIEVRPEGVFLIDWSSANKTWWSDNTSLAPEQPRRVQNGDRFQLGGEGGPWVRVEIAPAVPATMIVRPASTMSPAATLVIPPAPRPAPPLGRPPERPPIDRETLPPRVPHRGPAPLAYVPPPPDAASQAAASGARAMLMQQAMLITAVLVLAATAGVFFGSAWPAVDRSEQAAESAP